MNMTAFTKVLRAKIVAKVTPEDDPVTTDNAFDVVTKYTTTSVNLIEYFGISFQASMRSGIVVSRMSGYLISIWSNMLKLRLATMASACSARPFLYVGSGGNLIVARLTPMPESSCSTNNTFIKCMKYGTASVMVARFFGNFFSHEMLEVNCVPEVCVS